MTFSISTQSILSSMQQTVVKLQSELADQTNELSTGEYANLELALGGQTGQLVSLQAESSALQSMTNTNQLITTRLGTTQTTLQSIQTSAQNMLNSLIATGTSSVNAATVQSTGQSQLETLISQLNSSLQGNFLFAGTNTGTPPIADYAAPSSPAKLAVDNAFSATFGFSQSSPQVSQISGTDMQTFLDTKFTALFQGTSWTDDWSSASDQQLTDRISPTSTETTSVSANETPFKQLAQAYTMLADLGTQNLGDAAYSAVTSTAETLLRSAISGLTDLSTNVGTVQSDITDATSQMSLQMNLLTTQIGNLENVDAYEVSTRISELQTQIETSYAVTAQLKGLSLVNYLSSS